MNGRTDGLCHLRNNHGSFILIKQPQEEVIRLLYFNFIIIIIYYDRFFCCGLTDTRLQRYGCNYNLFFHFTLLFVYPQQN